MKKRDFSYQLYSSRKFPPLSRTLSMLSGFGYAQVEGYGALFGSVNDVRALKSALEETGLTMPTGHFGFDMLTGDSARVISIARDLGMQAVVVPFLPEAGRPTDAAGWDAFGQALAEAGKPILDAGLAFAWHNHAFEFTDLGIAERPLDLILSSSDSVQLELDLAWVQAGGQSPVEWIEKCADRILSVHLKDVATEGACADEDGWADVGHGVLDWPSINAALDKTGTRYFIVEHDNPSDDERFARRSLAAARSF